MNTLSSILIFLALLLVIAGCESPPPTAEELRLAEIRAQELMHLDEGDLFRGYDDRIARVFWVNGTTIAYTIPGFTHINQVEVDMLSRRTAEVCSKHQNPDCHARLAQLFVEQHP